MNLVSTRLYQLIRVFSYNRHFMQLITQTAYIYSQAVSCMHAKALGLKMIKSMSRMFLHKTTVNDDEEASQIPILSFYGSSPDQLLLQYHKDKNTRIEPTAAR